MEAGRGGGAWRRGMEVGVDRNAVLLSLTMKLFVLSVTNRVRVILGDHVMQLASVHLRQLKLKQSKVKKEETGCIMWGRYLCIFR